MKALSELTREEIDERNIVVVRRINKSKAWLRLLAALTKDDVTDGES